MFTSLSFGRSICLLSIFFQKEKELRFSYDWENCYFFVRSNWSWPDFIKKRSYIKALVHGQHSCTNFISKNQTLISWATMADNNEWTAEPVHYNKAEKYNRIKKNSEQEQESLEEEICNSWCYRSCNIKFLMASIYNEIYLKHA